MSEEAWGYTTKLRSWMFENVYSEKSTAKVEEKKAKRVIKELFFLYYNTLKPICPEEKTVRIVTDYISGMTDRYAIERFKQNFVPVGLKCGIGEDNLFKLVNED